MKIKTMLWLLILPALLLACGGSAAVSPEDMPQALVVSGGDVTRTYSLDDLAALPASESTFQEVAYKGVSLPALLRDAGFDPGAVRAVKAVAADGYSVNYEPVLFQREDVLVSYTQAAGPLTADEGTMRMVVPEAEGKLNVRMLSELQVLP